MYLTWSFHENYFGYAEAFSLNFRFQAILLGLRLLFELAGYFCI